MMSMAKKRSDVKISYTGVFIVKAFEHWKQLLTSKELNNAMYAMNNAMFP